jgi:HK97 family phage prohead protease
MVGHAAVFGEPTDIGGWFREQIEPGAFTASITDDDIRALWNHNPDYVLGRNIANTLTLTEDAQGLKTTITPPDTQFARDLAVSIERGDINQMSFSFQVLIEEWISGEGKGLDLRKIKKVKLYDVSPVTFPAYEGTDIALRSHETWAKTQHQQDPPDPPAAETAGTVYRRRQLLRRVSP